MNKVAFTALCFSKGVVCVCFAVAGFLLFGCASTGSKSVSGADVQKRQQALAKSDLLIIPRQRVGPIRMGMGWDEVIATLGEPDFSYTNTGDVTKIDTQMRFISLNLEVFFNTSATPTVNAIRVVTHPTRTMTYGSMTWADVEPVRTEFKTPEGIGLGASSFEVARTYGEYERDGTVDMNYGLRGLYFLVTKDHRIWSITTRN